MVRRGMFPGYVFAKFAYSSLRRAVGSSHGDRFATVPEKDREVVAGEGGAEEIVTVDLSLKIGQPVQFTAGPFEGVEVVITQLLPARERDSSAPRGPWSPDGNGSSCGQSITLINDDSVQTQSGRPEKRPLCFASFARTGALGWLTLQHRHTKRGAASGARTKIALPPRSLRSCEWGKRESAKPGAFSFSVPPLATRDKRH